MAVAGQTGEVTEGAAGAMGAAVSAAGAAVMPDAVSAAVASDAAAVSAAGAAVVADAADATAQSGEGRQVPVFHDARFRTQGKRGTFREVPTDAVPRVGAVTDSHCHLQLCAEPATEAARMEVWGVTRICNVIDLAEDGWETADALERWLDEGHELACAWAADVGVDPATLVRPRLSIIAGCHPENASRWDARVEAALRVALTDARVCAIGEAGLEYYYECSPREVQREMFRAHIRLAHEAGLPLCLHIRDAHDEALAMLEEEGFPQAGCVLHCFNLGAEALPPWLAHDCYVGLDGPITFRGSDVLRDAARTVPRTRLLVETDAPYMAPAPMRGMPCGPAHVIFTAACLAETLGVDADALPAFCAQLNENTARLYGRA